MTNPKTKGAGFERQAAKELEALLGIRFDRNPFEQQRQANQPDLIASDAAFPFSIECKRYKGGSFQLAWWQQSKNAANATGYYPCVIFKFDHKPIQVAVDWNAIGAMTGSKFNEDGLVFIDLEGFAFLAREIMASEKIHG